MGRTLWVNKYNVLAPVVATGNRAIDVLGGVDPDIRARATIVNIRLTWASIQTAFQDGTWSEGLGLVVGPEGGFTVAPDVLNELQDHSWLWTGMGFLSGSVGDTYPKRIDHEANIRSSRRMRAGQTTLWFSQSHILTGAGSLMSRLYLRILLYVL